MKMTSAYANKMLKQLAEEKAYWTRAERLYCTYDAADGETPVIPDYDYRDVAEKIGELDRKTCVIKHALNLSNATAAIPVQDRVMSVDELLVSMAQLNQRKEALDVLRKLQPKERLQLRSMPNAKNAVPEYRYINFDREVVKKDYEEVSERIMAMQIALDRHNQTAEFEVEL